MAFKDDILTDLDMILDDDEFATEATHTPRSTGTPSDPFNVIIGEAVLHGDDERNDVFEYEIEISGKTTDLVTVVKRDTITLNATDYEAVNNAVPDSVRSGWSVVMMRLPRLNETKI
jgi:hypothetical protein